MDIGMSNQHQGIASLQIHNLAAPPPRVAISGYDTAGGNKCCSNCGEETRTGFFDEGACLIFCKRRCVRDFYGGFPDFIRQGTYAL